jgi:tetratricopeptide (TPR) repeat protein
MLNQPKRKRNWNGTDFQSTEDSPSMIFVENLGSGGDLFKTSLTSSDNDTLMCVESEIAKASQLLVGGEGGINQYRNSYPNDPYLRLWFGLCLQENGNHQKAISEFDAATELGLDHWRLYWYKAKSAHQLRNKRVTKDALEKVKNEMPDFLPALELSEEIHHV